MSSRRIAFERYAAICAYCGFAIPAVLQVCHIDMDPDNNDPDNLVILCPTCHRMLDLDLISEETIKTLRDRSKEANWQKLMKDALEKAKRTREKKKREVEERSNRAKKAWETRRVGTQAAPDKGEDSR